MFSPGAGGITAQPMLDRLIDTAVSVSSLKLRPCDVAAFDFKH
jgi:hypothetical protein